MLVFTQFIQFLDTNTCDDLDGTLEENEAKDLCRYSQLWQALT